MELEEVIGALWSLETIKKPMNDHANGLVVRYEPKYGRNKSKNEERQK
jgi:hypothetical protein